MKPWAYNWWMDSAVDEPGLEYQCAEMEKAGNEGNIDLIREQTAAMLEEYRGYRKSLKYLFPDVPDEDEEKEADSGQINELLDKLAEAIEDFDSLTMEEVVENLSKFKLSGENETVKNSENL